MTATILRQKNDAGPGMLLDVIDDAAAQTGTGQWTVSAAMGLGVPVPTIAAAVMARSLSGVTAVRSGMENADPGAAGPLVPGGQDYIAQALYSAAIIAFAQGVDLIRVGAAKHGWPIDPAEVAAVWRDGCILRSRLLGRIENAYRRDPDLPHLLLDPDIAGDLDIAALMARKVLGQSVEAAIPLPAIESAFSYLHALGRPRLWTALTQAQRDMFGAHTYRRTDRGGSFHTDWGREVNLAQEGSGLIEE